MSDPVLLTEIPTTGRALLPVSTQDQCVNIGLWQLDLDSVGLLQVALDDAVAQCRRNQARAERRARVDRAGD